MDLGDTPWVERAMRTVWDRVATEVPETWMPVREGRKLVEFGCGAYGCVMPTSEPGLVCKLTSDVSEARFVVEALELPETQGIVQYKQIFGLAGEQRPAGWGHKRPLFILWRTEAFQVGFLTHRSSVDLDYWAFVRFARMLISFQREASVVRKWVVSRLRAMAVGREVRFGGGWGRKGRPIASREELLTMVWDSFEKHDPYYLDTGGVGMPSYLRGLDKVGVAINNAQAITWEMQGSQYAVGVGYALEHYLRQGLLLADVHAGNVGLDENNEPIITDPGHVIEIHPRWAGSLKVKEI